MPSPAVIAYSSASSVVPRLAPEKKNSVCGVMRNGASRRPKCSRYIVMAGLRAGGVLLLLFSAPRLAGIRCSEFSTGFSRRLQPSVEGAARKAQQLRRLGHVPLRDFERRVQV